MHQYIPFFFHLYQFHYAKSAFLVSPLAEHPSTTFLEPRYIQNLTSSTCSSKPAGSDSTASALLQSSLLAVEYPEACLSRKKIFQNQEKLLTNFVQQCPGRYPVTFLSFNCLALSSLPTLTPDIATTLAVGFFTSSTSCCNDSGDPVFAAT